MSEAKTFDEFTKRWLEEARMADSTKSMRKSELIEATWDEVDFENAVWTISKSRMKAHEDGRSSRGIYTLSSRTANYGQWLQSCRHRPFPAPLLWRWSIRSRRHRTYLDRVQPVIAFRQSIAEADSKYRRRLQSTAYDRAESPAVRRWWGSRAWALGSRRICISFPRLATRSASVYSSSVW